MTFQIGFITGMMLGLEFPDIPGTKWGIVIDLLIIRFALYVEEDE